MKALVRGEYTLLADHSPQPERVLVRAEVSARLRPHSTALDSTRSLYGELRARARRGIVTLRHDGVRVVASKAAHVVRNTQEAETLQCASFVGVVVDDRTERALPAGMRVAGISLTHPPNTELVVARGDHVFDVPAALPPPLGAICLYGALAVAATDAATRDGAASVGIAGDGTIARVVASLVSAAGRPIERLPGAAPLEVPGTGEPAPGGSSRIWIDAGLGSGGVDADEVIGIALKEAELRAGWPGATRHVAFDLHGLLRDPARIVDLFYYDGDVRWPPWLQPEHVRRYLAAAANGTVTLGSDAGDLELTSFGAAGGGRARFVRVRRPRTPGQAVHGVSVVGSGDWAVAMLMRQLAREDGIVLRGACDRRPEMTDLARRALPFEYVTTDYGVLLEDESTEMIVVSAYHGDHAPLAAAALRAGKHCFLEKPPVIDRAQLDDLMDAAMSSRRMLYVGYNRRFAPATRVLERHLAAETGPLALAIVVHNFPLPPNHWYFWPSNGNRIISNVCHFVDYALELTGARPVRVTATPAERGRADENVTIAVSFDDGSVASITYTKHGSDRSTVYYQSYDVLKGELTATNRDFERLDVYRAGRRVDGWRGPADLGHRTQLALVARALREGVSTIVPLSFARLSAETVLAASESALRGEPVQLAPPPSAAYAATTRSAFARQV